MNQTHNSVWNERRGTFVAASEKTSGKVKNVARGASLLIAGLMAGGPAWAACTGGGAGQTTTPMTANAGSNCTVDPSLGAVTVPGGQIIMIATGAGSTWTANQDLALTSQLFNSNVSQRWGVAADNGGQVLLNGAGNTYSVETNAYSTAHGVYARGADSLIRVEGNLDVTINGGGNPNANTATRGLIVTGGGVIEVLGHTTVHTTNTLWPGGANNRGISAEGGLIQLNTAEIDTKGPGAVGVLASGGSAGLVRAQGLVQITTEGSNAQGIAVWNGGQIELAQVDVLTQGNGSEAIRNANNGGAITVQGGALRTEGAGSAGIAQTLGTVHVTGPLTIETTGAGSAGVTLSGTGNLELAQTQIRTATDNSAGMVVTNTAAQGTALTLNGPLAIETQGAGSSGIRSVYNTANAVVVPTGSSILTHGDGAHGLDLQAPAGDLNAWNVAAGARIETQGKDAHPVYLSSKDGKVSFASAGDLVAGPQGSTGIFIASAPGGADVVSSGSIAFGTSTGSGISGVDLGGDVRIVNSGSIVKTGAGAGGAGIVVSHDGVTGTLMLDNQGSISSQGGPLSIGMQGIATGSGNVALLNSGTIGHTAAPVGYGLNGRVLSAGATLSVNNGGRIDAQLAGISAVSDGGFDVTNSGIVAESAVVALSLSGTGALGGSVANSGSLLAGSTAVLSQTPGSLSLSNSGTLRAPEAIRAMAGTLGATNTGLIHGTVQAAGGQIDLSNAGLWTNTGDSVLTSLSNSGTVTYTVPVGGTYKTVTVGNYVGQGGQINLNTWLGDDGSPSDRLVIDGGSATGSTRLGITNTGGAGARTTGNGILVVDAQNGATTGTGAFSLAGPVSAGAYDYSLVRRANQSWYLSSDLITVPPVDPGTPTGPVTPGVTPPASLPNYRQETSLYAAVPSLAVLHSAATMDSFHERMGAAGYAAGDDGRPARLWVRLIGSNGKRKGDALGVYGRSGPAYDHKTAALQLGGDFYQGRNDDGSRTHAGLYFATGQTSGDVRHFNGAAAGSAKLDVTSLGLYWTLLGEQGGYVDFVAQGSHYGVKATSTRMPGVKSSGTGYDVSVEGGLPFSLGGAWTLEPQLQLRRQQADLGGGVDLAGRVNYGDVDSLVGRAGLKLGYATPKLSAWARLDLLNEFQGRSTTTVSSLAGLHGVSFDSSVHGRSLALTAGVDARLTQAVSLYGSASYRRALGDSRGHAWGAQAGVKVAW